MQIKSERQSSFELLRIISMLLIIGLHYYNLGFCIPDDEPISFNYLYLRFVGFGGRVGVDMFVLISGYFLVGQKFKPTRAVKIVLQTGLITAAFQIVRFVLGECGIKSVIKGFFAVFTNYHWFITSYFLLYLASDFLSSMLRAAGRRGHLALVCILLTIYSVLPTCLGMRMDASNFMLFVMLYVIAAYIKLYSPKLLDSKYCLIAGVGLHWLCFAISSIFVVFSSRNMIFLQIADRMSAANDLTIVACSVLIFAGFRNLRLPNSKLINNVAASTLGVYLLHMNPFHTKMWVNLLRTKEFYESRLFFLHAPLTIMSVFVCCTLVDMLYRRFIQDPLMHIIENRWDTWENKLCRHLPAVLKKEDCR